MSFSDVFHDYINDIPMDISRKFYPTPNINVESFHLPDKVIFSTFEYSFAAESRAREQFDKQNEVITLQSTSTTSSAGTETKSSISPVLRDAASDAAPPPVPKRNILSQDVLVPCPVNSAPVTTAKPLTPNTVSLPHSLHEFESINNVFDDVQMLALDDRKALQEVLMSGASNPNTESSSSSPLLFNSFPTNSAAKSINNNLEKSNSAKEKGKEHEELRKRLLTKGYRKDIVEKSLSSVPKNRLVHVEYYMKACRTVEKTGRSTIDDVLPYLIQCSLTDKNTILAYSESCAALLKMGFNRDEVFEAVAVERGDQANALKRLLSGS